MLLGLDLRTNREVAVKVFDAGRCPLPARLRYQGLIAAALGVTVGELLSDH